MINNRQNNRRRGRGGGPRPNGANPGNDRGNRIDNRARGNANQLYEKYKTLARDAQMQGDRVMSEYYFQFADHYFRVLSEQRPRFEEQNRGRPDQQDRDDQYDYADDGDGDGDAQPEAGSAPYGNRERGQRMDRMDRPERSDRQERPDRFERDARPERDRPQQQSRPMVDAVPMVEADEDQTSYSNGHAGMAEQAAAEEPALSGRGRRGRPRKDVAAPDLLAGVETPESELAKIEIDRLPPAFAADEAESASEKPKRRGRRPRAESAAADA